MPLPSSIALPDLIAFDLETSGFSPVHHAIIEIGAVRFSLQDESSETFQCLANPGRPLDAKVAALTGIDDGMLAEAGAPLHAVETFVRWSGEGALFFAHNAAFDCRFLNAAFLNGAGTAPLLYIVDSLAYARRLKLPVANHQLATLAAHEGVSHQTAHRALGDAKTLAALLRRWLAAETNPAAAVMPFLVQPRHGRRVDVYAQAPTLD